MKKGLKYTLVSLGSLVVLAGVGLGIMYVVSPYKVKRWVGIASSYSDVFVDRLKGQPYTYGGYDGIDVSKHNGVIKWKEIAKNKRIKFVYIRATHGKGYVDRHYCRNIRLARKYGLKVGSYHLMSAGPSVTAQFLDFQKMAKKSEQDLIPVLDVEEKGIQGRWKGRQLQDSIQVFADLVKKHYGKYPVIYSNESYCLHGSSYHAHQAVPRGTRDGELVNKRRATRDHEAGNKCPNREPQFGQYKKKLKYINNKGESRVKDF